MLDQTMTIDRATIEEYLTLLTGSTDTPMHWRFLPERGTAEEKRILEIEKAERQRRHAAGDPDWRKFAIKRNYPGTLSEVWDDLVAHQEGTALEGQLAGWGIFVAVNEGGPNAKSITRVRALFVDMDGARAIDAGKWHAKPDFICQRSETRWHAYWLVDDCPPEQFEEAQKHLALHYGSDPAVHDLSRVLRVPGTVHLKDPAAPLLFKLIPMREAWGPRRTVAELMEGLPPLPAPEVTAKPEPSPAGSAGDDRPVTDKQRREVLSWINPEPYDDWFTALAALHGSYRPDDPDRDVGGRAIANEFSMGSLDRFGRLPGNYDADAVDVRWDNFTDKPNGAGFGTLVHMAKLAGMQWGEPPRDTSRTAGETFGDYADAEEAERYANDGDQDDDWPEGPAERKDTGPFLETLEDLLARPDPKPLIKGFLMQGENVCIVGPPKGGKTHGMIDTALSQATGLRTAAGLEVLHPGPVVYLSGEGHSGMKKRIKAWCQDHGLRLGIGRYGRETVFGPDDKPIPFFYRAGVPLARNSTNGEAVRYIKGITEFLKKEGLGEAALFFIDTMARSFSGANENDSGDAGLYLEMTEEIRAGLGRDCTSVTVAHCPKNVKGEIEIRGSGSFTGGLEGVFTWEMNEANGVMKLEGRWFKDTPHRGPWAFKLKKVTVAGMAADDAEAVVLTSVAVHEFHQQQRYDAAREIARQMVEFGMVGPDNGLTDQEFAERRQGPRPPSQDRAALALWIDAVKRDVKHLQNGARSRNGKPGIYTIHRRPVLRPGATDTVNLWFFPDHEGPE